MPPSPHPAVRGRCSLGEVEGRAGREGAGDRDVEGEHRGWEGTCLLCHPYKEEGPGAGLHLWDSSSSRRAGPGLHLAALPAPFQLPGAPAAWGPGDGRFQPSWDAAYGFCMVCPVSCYPSPCKSPAQPAPGGMAETFLIFFLLASLETFPRMSACSPLQPKSWGSVLGGRHGPTRLVAARSPRSKDTEGRHRGCTRAAPPRPQPSSVLRLLLHEHPRLAAAGCTAFPAPRARIQIKGGFVRVQSAKITRLGDSGDSLFSPSREGKRLISSGR